MGSGGSYRALEERAVVFDRVGLRLLLDLDKANQWNDNLALRIRTVLIPDSIAAETQL
jgi:hypothetical protein